MAKYLTTSLLALASVGAGVYYWKQISKPNTDYDIVITVKGNEWHFTAREQLPATYHQEDTIVVSVVGFFKRGKTFVINNLFGCNLPQGPSLATAGIGIIKPMMNSVGVGVRVLDTEGLDAPAPASDVGARREMDLLTVKLACQLSDFIILCVNYWGNHEQRLFMDIQRDLEVEDKAGADKMVVIHNYYQVEDPEEVEKTFQEYVIRKFNCKRVDSNIKTASGGVQTFTYWVSQQEHHKYPTYHFVLGREGARSGRRFNKPCFAAISHLISSSAGRARPRNMISEARAILTSPVAAEEAGQAVVVCQDS